jgi:predicted nucleic acid-binding protein
VDIVIDTSVLIAVIANEPEKATLIRLTTGATLYAPASVHWEIGNAFSAMLKRRRITLAQAQQALEAYQQIPIRYLDVDLRRAVELADAFGSYAYDAYVVDCALQLRCPLLALDRGLLASAREAGIEVLEITP